MVKGPLNWEKHLEISFDPVMGTDQHPPFTFLLLLEKCAWAAPWLPLPPDEGGV